MAPAAGPTVIPVLARAKLAVLDTHGRSPYAVVGERIRIAGSVTPYVPGQTVVVTVWLDGRRVLARRLGVNVAPGVVPDAAGRFQLAYASPRHGLIAVEARHAASPQMAAFATRAVGVRFFGANLSAGSHGPAVWALQRELGSQRYAVPLDGRFGEATAKAVIAYHKVTGLARVGATDARIFAMLQRGAGRFRARYPRQGAHVEADLTRQVLAEVEPRGRVRRIYTMSSGKPSTPTVVGRFRVYEKTPGINSKGMVDSSYFIGGYAIHGYAEVPTYAASHGCLRIPIPDAAAVYAWVKLGYPVDVYDDHGRGSLRVRPHPGP